MTDKVQFELVSPAKLLLSEDVEMVVVPGGEGDFGVLPGHTPMLATVRPGIINIYENDKVVKSIFVEGGFADVTESRCAVLAEEAIALEDLDSAVAASRLEKAKAELEKADGDVARKKAEAELATAEAMVEACNG